FFWESDAILDGSVQRIVERLIPLSKEEGGAHYLDLSAFGLEGDAAKYVFVRRDGTSLYTTRDIAYHLNKMGRCDVAIDIVGEDHKLSFQRLKAAFQLMGIDWAPEARGHLGDVRQRYPWAGLQHPRESRRPWSRGSTPPRPPAGADADSLDRQVPFHGARVGRGPSRARGRGVRRRLHVSVQPVLPGLSRPLRRARGPPRCAHRPRRRVPDRASQRVGRPGTPCSR